MFGFSLFELLYGHKYLRHCLGELIKTAHDMFNLKVLIGKFCRSNLIKRKQQRYVEWGYLMVN
jgi:hypothetical protein